MSQTVDLNADVGEECGDDEALLAIVTTANVAAGGHAGGGEVLAETVRLAVAASVAVGAHPSYPDRAAFGRVSRADLHDGAAIAAVAAFVRQQVLAVSEACAVRSIPLSHVKAHGALYNDAAAHDAVADAFVAGVAQAATDLGRADLPVLGMSLSALERACDRRGVPFVREAFADRAYLADGSLMPRGRPGAVLGDVEAVVRQVLRVVRDGVVEAIDGTLVPMPAATICVHGDTPGAVAMAGRVREELQGQGFRIAAPGRSA